MHFKTTVRYYFILMRMTKVKKATGENYNSKRSMNLSAHCSTIYNSQDIEAT